MDYMGLFPGYTRDLPRFSALAEAVLRQVTDLMAAVEDISSGFSVEHAQGVQLDALGNSFAVSRKYGWTDETYRGVILRKLKRNTWNATEPSPRAAAIAMRYGMAFTAAQKNLSAPYSRSTAILPFAIF